MLTFIMKIQIYSVSNYVNQKKAAAAHIKEVPTSVLEAQRQDTGGEWDSNPKMMVLSFLTDVHSFGGRWRNSTPRGKNSICLQMLQDIKMYILI